jgi:hypothetical protein
MKMGTIASRSPYDAAAHDALQSASLTMLCDPELRNYGDSALNHWLRGGPKLFGSPIKCTVTVIHVGATSALHFPPRHQRLINHLSL